MATVDPDPNSYYTNVPSSSSSNSTPIGYNPYPPYPSSSWCGVCGNYHQTGICPQATATAPLFQPETTELSLIAASLVTLVEKIDELLEEIRRSADIGEVLRDAKQFRSS